MTEVTDHKISFHEATITALSQSGEDVELCLEDVLVDDRKASVTIKVFSCSTILVDGSPSSTLSMEAEDGEVYSLFTSNEGFSLIAQWNDFAERRSVVTSHDVMGKMMTLTISSVSDDN